MHAPPPVKRQPLSEAVAAGMQNLSHPNRLFGWLILVLVSASVMPDPLGAESMFILEAPGIFEDIRATTFDDKGRAVGKSSFETVIDEAGAHHMSVTMAIEDGGRNVSEAILAPIPNAVERGERADNSKGLTIGPIGPAPGFRILEERSQATRADGVSLDYLVIDHVMRRVSCYPPDRDLTKGRHVDLPREDRVVNVPMQLLFSPLVSRELETLRFQIALCRDGPALYKMVAVRGPMSHRAGRDVLEIRYGPDLGKTVAWFASRLLPRFSFWFDTRDGSYLGHRMPLHRKGPRVLLVREGLTPPDIGVD